MGKGLTFFVNAYKTMNIVKRCSSNYNDEKEVVVLVVTQAHKVENPLCFCFSSSHTFSSSLPHDACDHVCGVYAHGVRVCECHVYVRARGDSHEDARLDLHYFQSARFRASHTSLQLQGPLHQISRLEFQEQLYVLCVPLRESVCFLQQR